MRHASSSRDALHHSHRTATSVSVSVSVAAMATATAAADTRADSARLPLLPTTRAETARPRCYRRRRCSAELTTAEFDAPAALLFLSSSGSSSSSDDSSDSDADMERVTANSNDNATVSTSGSDSNCAMREPCGDTSAAAIESSSTAVVVSASTKQRVQTPKRVRWSTITIHEFGVGLGGSAVPTKGGPAIGLGAAPEFTWVTKVGEMAERSEGVHRFSPAQRKRLLQAAGVADVMIERFSRETSIILGSRRRSVIDDLTHRRRREDTGEQEQAGEREGEDEDEDEDKAQTQVLVQTQTRTRSRSEEETKPRKRRAEHMTSSGPATVRERPCAVYSRRPRMIPVNYV